MIHETMKEIIENSKTLGAKVLELRTKVPLSATSSHEWLRMIESSLASMITYSKHAQNNLDSECPELMQITDVTNEVKEYHTHPVLTLFERPKTKVQISRWINVYQYGSEWATYSTASQARKYANETVIASVELTGEYEA